MRLLVLTILLAAGLTAQEQPPAAALLTALDGEVAVVHPPSPDPSPARILGELFPGDQLKTGPASTATVLYQDGKIATVGENSTVMIPVPPPDSNRGGPSVEGQNQINDRPGRLVALIAEGEKIAANLAVRGEEDSLALCVYEPGNTTLLTGSPRFVWGRYSGAQLYRIKVQRMGSDVWSAITVDTLLSYPENKPPLEPGAYLLRVFASTDHNDTLSMTERAVRVLSPEQADSVLGQVQGIREQRPDSFTFHLLCAKLYEDRNLRFEAIREYEALNRIKPDLPFIHLSLSILYKENGQTRPANLHYDRWKELGGSPE